MLFYEKDIVKVGPMLVRKRARDSKSQSANLPVCMYDEQREVIRVDMVIYHLFFQITDKRSKPLSKSGSVFFSIFTSVFN